METGVQSVIDYNALIEREAAAFFEAAARYLKPEDVQLLRQAFEVSREAHEGQTRKSGEPYITHPLAVATILAELGMTASTLAAALLHDTVEDTEYSLDLLRADFGDEIAHETEEREDVERLAQQLAHARQRLQPRHDPLRQRAVARPAGGIGVHVRVLEGRVRTARSTAAGHGP